MKTNILLLVVIALILLSVGSTMSVQSDVDTTLPGGVDSDDNLILYTSEQSSEEETTPVEVVEEEPEEEQEETETEEKVATVATTSGGSSGGGSSGSSSAVSSTVTSTEQAIACSCGDGTVDSGEECDDGNLIDGDGCSANCDLEVPDCVDADLEFDVDLMVIGIDCLDGWDKPQDQVAIDIPVGARYEVEGQAWRGHPGQCQTNEDFFMEINGDIGYETNDDADSCKISVRMDPLGTFDFNTGLNDVIMHTAAQCPPDVHPNSVEVKKLCLFYVEECGNGILDPDEDCDDGNDVDDDECRNDCTAPFCGDGILDPSEDCDDGNNVDGDGCSALCLNEVCGDGVLQPDEECEFDSDCDDSDEYTSDSCVDCSCAYERIPFCGDWVLDPGEECDNGPNNSDIVPDACREDCSLPCCGDFVVDSWEECDDGNDVSGDGCQANC
ncbi:MAG: DUF4215 domain-containing protein, partial [bacterium]|nr:DUF4215 domain-containing protein [bacterium]